MHQSCAVTGTRKMGQIRNKRFEIRIGPVRIHAIESQTWEAQVLFNRTNKLSRRDFLKLSLAASGGLALAGGGYAGLVEPRWVEFTSQNLPIRNLPDNLIGAALVQISDMHIGNRYNREYQISALEKARALEPDFVTYTGDFISYETDRQIDQLYEVFAYAPRGTYGTVAILGNHDYGHHWQMPEVARSVVEVLGHYDIPVLRNERISLSGLDIIGLDDYWATNYDPEPVLNSIDGKRPSIVLCHNPDVVDQPVWAGYKGWILSGHTHGGQVKPPFLPPPMLPVRNTTYTSGAFDLGDGRNLYINRALGNLWPVRFNVRPEITVYTLSNTSALILS